MKLVIWGTGVYGRDLLAYIKNINVLLKKDSSQILEVICFFDNVIKENKSFLEGVIIKKPSLADMYYADMIVVAVKCYEEIISQIKGMGMTLEKVCIYNANHKIRFIDEVFKKFPNGIHNELFHSYVDKLEKVRYVAGMINERDNVKWEKLLTTWKPEQFMAAIEEVRDGALSRYLYETLFRTFRAEITNKNIAIYYYRFYNGGVERVIEQLMPIFLRLGYKVVLVTEEFAPEKEYRCPKQVIREVLPRKGVDRFERYRLLGEILERHDIGIAYIHGYFDYDLSSMMIPYLHSRSIYVILHVHNYYKFVGKIDELAYAYGLADRVIVLSKVDENFWIKKGIRAKYVPNPIRLKIPYAYHAQKATVPTIAWVGRVDDGQKQVYEIVDVMRELSQMLPEVKLKIIGKADDMKVMEELKRRVHKNGLDDKIIFCGFMQEPWMECCDVDAILYTSAYDGFPLVLAESKMVGLPAVIYSLPYLELLKDGMGYLEVRQRDAKEAAIQLAKIISEKKLQERLSREARVSIEKFAAFDLAGLWHDLLTGK